MKAIFAAAAILPALATSAGAVTFVAQDGSQQVFAESATGAQVTFDAAAAPGFSVVGGATRSGTLTNVGTAPLGSPTDNVYLYVSIGKEAVVTSLAQSYQTISFYFGSIDSGNSVELLGINGTSLRTFTGAELAPTSTGNANLSPERNRLLTFSAAAGESFTGLRLTSSVNSLEVDNIRFGAPAVPEPATWMTMILGFAAVGCGLRRRRSYRTV